MLYPRKLTCHQSKAEQYRQGLAFRLRSILAPPCLRAKCINSYSLLTGGSLTERPHLRNRRNVIRRMDVHQDFTLILDNPLKKSDVRFLGHGH